MNSLAAAITTSLLHLVFPAQSTLQEPVKVEFSREGNNLIVDFDVTTPTINAKPVLAPGEYPFQFDVVEVFVSVEGSAAPQSSAVAPTSTNYPYYEFELSPYGQAFEVKLISPKKHIDGVSTGATYRVEWLGDNAPVLPSAPRNGFINASYEVVTESAIQNSYPPIRWHGQMVIPLDKLGWKGDPRKVVGNAYAVLGARPNRSYWSLFLPPQRKPNFHVPSSFRPLLP